MESAHFPPTSTPEPNADFRYELEKCRPSRSITSAESATSSVRVIGNDPEKQEPVSPKPHVNLNTPAICPHSTESEHALSREQDRVIPPADGGPGAWLFLAGCFGIEALVWGFPFCFGVFQNYYSTHEPFASESGIPVIGTCATGLMYFEATFLFAMGQRWPKFRRHCGPIGLFIIVLALITSSFSTHVWHLILTQGILYGIGGGILYAPVLMFLDEWFVKRKGLAFGVMMAATGMSGVALPFVLDWALNRYSYRTMLRVWGVVNLLLCGPLLYFIRPRLPVLHRRRPFSFAFFRTPTFWLFQIGSILESLGFFIPTIYLPTFAREILGSGKIEQTLTVSIFNTASVIGAVFAGLLTDKLHISTVIMILTIGTCGSVFLVWGLAAQINMGWTLAFCVFYGLTAGGYSSTWSGFVRQTNVDLRRMGERDEPGVGLMYGLLLAGRGIGSVASGPISENLVGKHVNGFGAYGTAFGGLIIFTGITALLGGLGYAGRLVGLVGDQAPRTTDYGEQHEARDLEKKGGEVPREVAVTATKEME